MVSVFVSVMLLLSPAEHDSLLAEIPSNSGFWEEVFNQYSGDTLSYIESLFLTMPTEDRTGMTAAILEDHILKAMDSKNIWYESLPDSIFLRYLLPFRIDDEPLSSYRSALGAWLARRVQPGETAVAMAEEINDVITRTITSARYTNDGSILTPTQIIPMGQASREGRWVLLGASLRTMGIPVRPVKGWFPGVDRNLYLWFDIWTGEEWHSLSDGIPPLAYVKAAIEYPSMRNITGDYRDTGTLLTTPLVDFIEGDWSVELLIPSGPDTAVIDNVYIDPFEKVSTELGAGEFLLKVQFSHLGEVTGTWLQNIVISADSTTVIDLTKAEYAITPLPR
ncbi:MAG: hypothetical protein GQ565_08975 [Candidatus Aegiribacteria sp.]|nr:hypothetical protein [Candidatus Aegiribacteria sp.]